MLTITCPDGIYLKFMDERNLECTVEYGTLTVKNQETKEILVSLVEGKWTNYLYTTYVMNNAA